MGPQEIKPQIDQPHPLPNPISLTNACNKRNESLKKRETEEMDPPKKSISMGQIQASNSRSKSGLTVKSTDGVDGVKGSSIGSPRKKEYKSEYKNKFRPFSQYEYVGEGKFFNTTNSPPTEVDGPSSLVSSEKMEGMESGPWYKEVQELRKVANDYKCRGWGTDLVPPHISQIYNHHEQ